MFSISGTKRFSNEDLGISLRQKKRVRLMSLLGLSFLTLEIASVMGCYSRVWWIKRAIVTLNLGVNQ